MNSPVILLVSVLLLAGCKSQSKPAARIEVPPEPFTIDAKDGHYSEKYHYHVTYPPNTEASPADGPNAEDEGEVFIVHVGGDGLIGEVSGNRRDQGISSAARCQQRIQILQTYEDYDVRPYPAPPLLVTYKVVKPTWYVFSGTRDSDVYYEKGFVYGNVTLTLRLHYAVATKDIFDPLAAKIAASFEDYQIATSKAGVMVGEEGQPGLLFLDPLPDEVQNQHTTCAVDPKDRAQFSKVREGQTVTVAGQPELLVVRTRTDEYSGMYENRIRHCQLKLVGPE